MNGNKVDRQPAVYILMIHWSKPRLKSRYENLCRPIKHSLRMNGCPCITVNA